VYPYPYYPYQSGTSAGGGGTIATGCCPGRLLPEKLYGTLVNATGDCANYQPTTWEFTYDNLLNWWQSTPPPTIAGSAGLPGVDYVLVCNSDGLGNYVWLLGYVSPVSDCQVNVTAICNPLLLTFDFVGAADPACSNDDFGGRLCNGTYQIIITE
jgi:hypothetical protein